MRGIILSFFFLPFLLTAAGSNESMAVVIIGGGPAGLACAIEAVRNGCDTTIVEKREEYTREQPIVLWNRSLKIMDKWDIFAPEILLSNCFEDGVDRGRAIARRKYLTLCKIF
jgi:2-polyprenyl-6-methoxyphenol hydroxylase-like FAD-dependent oxidoreductase